MPLMYYDRFLKYCFWLFVSGVQHHQVSVTVMERNRKMSFPFEEVLFK